MRQSPWNVKRKNAKATKKRKGRKDGNGRSEHKYDKDGLCGLRGLAFL